MLGSLDLSSRNNCYVFIDWKFVVTILDILSKTYMNVNSSSYVFLNLFVVRSVDLVHVNGKTHKKYMFCSQILIFSCCAWSSKILSADLLVKKTFTCGMNFRNPLLSSSRRIPKLVSSLKTDCIFFSPDTIIVNTTIIWHVIPAPDGIHIAS